MRTKGFTLIELLVVIIILGLLMSFVVPAVLGALRRVPVTQCKNNLSQLFQLSVDYKSRFGGPLAIWPDQTGDQYITQLYNAYQSVGQGADVTKVWHCPVVGQSAPPPTYTGPNVTITEMTQTNVIICRDKDNNHQDQGGCVVIRGKAVIEFPENQWNTIITSGVVP